MGDDLRYTRDGAWSTWSLTNGNTTRHAGGVCVDDPDAGPAICDSPIFHLATLTRWQACGLRGTRPLGTGFKLYFRIGASSGAVSGATWLGPFDSFDETLGTINVNMDNELERESIANTGTYGQLRIKIMPS